MPTPINNGVWTVFENDIHGGHVVLVKDGIVIHHFYGDSVDNFIESLNQDAVQAKIARRNRQEVIAAARRADGYV